MIIDKKQVKHIAALAKLRIDEADIEKLSREMGEVIAFADRLGELEINEADAAEFNVSELVNVFREDLQGESYPNDEILANAPEKYEGCYVVPKIVE